LGRTAGFLGAIGLTAVATGLYATAGREKIRRWGATDEERDRLLPGDDLIPKAVYESTHAITIDAPPEAVWPWLVQMGQGRGGFYSYDWVEAFGGLDIQSADRIVPELQSLGEGAIVRLAPNTALLAATVERPHALVLRAIRDVESKEPPVSTDPGYFDWSWAFVVEPIDNGQSRLIIRLRADTAQTPPFNVLGPAVWEPLHLLMERKMLRGIRDRVERAAVRGVVSPVS
jgi:hypothetical protein